MSIAEDSRRITTAFEQAGIRYMAHRIVRGRSYGVPRSTQDIDFVVEATPAQLQSVFIESLPATEYYSDLRHCFECPQAAIDVSNVIDHATGWKVDLIIRKSRTLQYRGVPDGAKASTCTASLSLSQVPRIVVISKLEWAKLAQSRRQVEDAAAILRVRWDALDHGYLRSDRRFGTGEGLERRKECGQNVD